MSNQGFIGFLIRKTVQPHSQRKDFSNFNDFRNSNMNIYLNKKIADIRSRNGDPKLPKQVYTQTQLQIKPKAQIDENNKKKNTFTNYKVEDEVLRIVQKQIKPEYKDDFFIESKNTQARPKTSKKPLDVTTKIRVMMNDHISERELDEMFTFYKRENLKATINQIQAQMKDPKFYQKFQERVIKNGLQQLEFDDKEQVNFFMKKVCEQPGEVITAGKVLQVNEDNIEYKNDITDEFEAMRNIVQKRITKEQLEQIMEHDEEEQKKRLVKIFKETRPDQIDPDFFKNKVKMTTMKKLNEAQEKQFDGFFSQKVDMDNYNDKKLSTDRFIRQPKKYNRKFTHTKSKIKFTQQESTARLMNTQASVPDLKIQSPNFQPTEESSPFLKTQKTRPQTAFTQNRPMSNTTKGALGSFFTITLMNQGKKIDQEVIDNIVTSKRLQKKAQNIVNECHKAEQNIQKDKHQLEVKIDRMEENINKVLNVMDMMEKVQQQMGGGNQTMNKEYHNFVQERKFKKKLVSYLVEHLQRKSDLLSQKTIETKSKQLLSQLIPDFELSQDYQSI